MNPIPKPGMFEKYISIKDSIEKWEATIPQQIQQMEILKQDGYSKDEKKEKKAVVEKKPKEEKVVKPPKLTKQEKRELEIQQSMKEL